MDEQDAKTKAWLEHVGPGRSARKDSFDAGWDAALEYVRRPLGLAVGDLDPLLGVRGETCSVNIDGYLCTEPPGHVGPHIATDGLTVLAVRENKNWEG